MLCAVTENGKWMFFSPKYFETTDDAVRKFSLFRKVDDVLDSESEILNINLHEM